MTREEKNKIWFDSLLRIATSEALKNETDLLPLKEELDEMYYPSDELNKRIKKIITINRLKRKVHNCGKIARKIAIVIIVLFAASLITLLSVEATRNAIFNAIIEKFDKYTEIKFNKGVEDETNNKLYSPIYLPQGFRETSVVTYGNSIMIIYTNNVGNEILFKQRPVETGTILIDNENTNCKEIKINGNEAYLFEAMTIDDYNILLWQSEGVVFELQALIKGDELIQIGNSIKNN